MNQSPLPNKPDDTPSPITAPQRAVSVRPIKIDYDCSRGRGNFDQDNENDYDKYVEIKPSYNHSPRDNGQPLLTKSKSLEINKFRYTPGSEGSQFDQQQVDTSVPSPISPTSPASSPKRESSFKKSNNKQSNQNNNNSVSFGGKSVDDHKSNQNRKRGSNQDRGQNYNRNNNDRSGGSRNKSRGIPHSNSLSFSFGTKLQQNQPSQTNLPSPLPPAPKITTSQSNSLLKKPTEWKPTIPRK